MSMFDSSENNQDSDGEIIDERSILVFSNGDTEESQVSQVNMHAGTATRSFIYEIGNDTNAATEFEENNPEMYVQDSSLLQLSHKMEDMCVTLGGTKTKSSSNAQNPFKLSTSDETCVQEHLNCSVFSFENFHLAQLDSPQQSLQVAVLNKAPLNDELCDLQRSKFYQDVQHFNLVFSKWRRQQSEALNKAISAFKNHYHSKQLSVRQGKANWHHGSRVSLKRTQNKKNILSKSKLNFIVTHVADMSSSTGSMLQNSSSISSLLEDPLLGSFGLDKGYEPHPKKVRQVMMEFHELNFLLHNSHLTLSATFTRHLKKLYCKELTHIFETCERSQHDVTPFSLSTLSAALPSAEDSNEARDSERATGQLRSLLARSHCDDVTIDELASYFDNLVHIPKKMSTMAEMMYT